MRQILLDSNIKYIECECRTELLQLTYEKEEDMLYISYYSCGQSGNYYSIRSRIRHIWRIIKYGTPYSDYIILNRREINKLKMFLLKT